MPRVVRAMPPITFGLILRGLPWGMILSFDVSQQS
jgi:hypothetical protein